MLTLRTFFLEYRFISSIRGELVPYLVRKQFSKMADFQKSKDDTDDQKNQKMKEGSAHHGQCWNVKATLTAAKS